MSSNSDGFEHNLNKESIQRRHYFILEKLHDMVKNINDK
jgi:hypothetical protein